MRYMLLIYKDEKSWGETCYNIVEAQNLDEAISIVARNPLLGAGHSFEVGPIRERPPR